MNDLLLGKAPCLCWDGEAGSHSALATAPASGASLTWLSGLPCPKAQVLVDEHQTPCLPAWLLHTDLRAGSHTHQGHSLQFMQAVRQGLHDPLDVPTKPLIQGYILTRCKRRGPLGTLESMAMMPLPHVDTILWQHSIADQLLYPGPQGNSISFCWVPGSEP